MNTDDSAAQNTDNNAQNSEDMSATEVTQHLQTAASNAQVSGQPDVAQEIGDLVSRYQSDPQGLKDAAVSYVKSNPQVLAHFAPSFAQGVLSKL